MRRINLLIYAITISAVFFVSGIAVGQRKASKFAKDLQPMNLSYMDYVTFESSVNQIRENLGEANNRITPPRVYFNREDDKIHASARISQAFEKGSLDAVKSMIIQRYYETYYDLKDYVPELSEDDFDSQNHPLHGRPRSEVVCRMQTRKGSVPLGA